MSQTGPFSVEEHVHGDTVWVAIRSRGAEWSWFTREEAARVGREWVAKYGQPCAEDPADRPLAVAAE